MSRVLASLALVCLLLGCSRDTLPPTDAGYAYFPLQTGSILEYEITEIRYIPARLPESRTYQLRETIGEKYTDAAGQDVYRVERARREGNSWKTDSIWTAWRTLERAFRSENGLVFVKLDFPVAPGKVWDGNQFNALDRQPYEISDLGQAGGIGSLAFGKILTVVQQNDSTLLTLRRRKEQYAEGIGLIHWEQTNVEYCATPDCLGRGIIEFGTRRTGHLTRYEK